MVVWIKLNKAQEAGAEPALYLGFLGTAGPLPLCLLLLGGGAALAATAAVLARVAAGFQG